jgi:hypothetical protein
VAKSLVQTVIAWSDFILISFDYGKLVGERAEKGIDPKLVGALLVHSPLKGYADGLTDKHLILQRIDDSAIWRTLLMERCTYVSHLLLIDKYLG